MNHIQRNALLCFLIFICCLSSFCAWSQFSAPDGQGNISTGINTQKVGIATNNPTASLEIGNYSNNAAMLRVGITGNRANANAQILNSLNVVGVDANDKPAVGAVAWDYYNMGNQPSFAGTLLQHTGTGVAGTANGLPAANQGQMIFQNVSNGVICSNGANIHIAPFNNVVASFLNNGNVLIGKTSQTNSGYKLDVAGTVRADKVVVNTSGADFVFDSAYRVLPLTDVEAYIAKNHHLPGFSSAEDMKKVGLDVGEQSTKLLQKVEELTLYVIRQNKLLEQQAQLLKAQQARIGRLEKKVKH